MITKILFTALVFISAIIFIRHKNRQSRQQEVARQAEQAADHRTAMFVAVALVSLTLVISAGIYYSHWKEQHRIYIVQVTNSYTADEQTYHVYQGDINGRSFRTIDGRKIYISDSERMEVREKDVDGVK